MKILRYLAPLLAGFFIAIAPATDAFAQRKLPAAAIEAVICNARDSSRTIQTLTIASGSVTASECNHLVDTESSASTDDLTTVVPWSGITAGQTVELSLTNASRDVVLKNGSGSNLILTPDGGDYVLGELAQIAVLRWTGSQWRLLDTGGAAVTNEPLVNEVAATELTIASGAVTPTAATHTIDTESDASTDDLVTITGTNFKAGDIFVLSAINGARDVVLKASGGNILLPDDEDITLDDAEKTVVLRFDGTNWNYVAGGGGLGDGIWETVGGHFVLSSDPNKADDFPFVEIDLVDSSRGLVRVPNFQVVDFGDPPDVSCLYGEGTRSSPTTNTTVGGHTCKFYNWNYDGDNFTGDNVAPFLEIADATRAERDASATCAITVADTDGVGTITISNDPSCLWTLNDNTGFDDRKFETNFAVEIVSAGNPSLEDKKLVVTGVTGTVLSYTSRHGALADVGPLTSGLKVKEVTPVVTPYLGWSGYIGWRSLELFDDHSKGALMDFATTAPDQIATIPRMWLSDLGLTVGPTALIYCATYPWSIRDIPNDQQFLPCDTFNPHEFATPAYLTLIGKDIDTKPAFAIVPEAEPTFRLYAGWDESDDEFKFRSCENTTECHPFLTVRGDTQYVKVGGRNGTQPVMAFDGGDSAVNHFVAENSTAGNPPKIRTTGSDTDVPANFETQGTASVLFHNGVHTFEEDGDSVFQMTDSGATVGPQITLKRLSTTAATNDILSRVRTEGQLESNGSVVGYHQETVTILDPSSGGRAGRWQLETAAGGGLATRLIVEQGLQVGTPTGGDRGVGTINVATDVEKNDTAYTNPDYALEHYYTGKIDIFKDNEGAEDYPGLMPLDELEAYMKEHYHLPRVPLARGIFERADVALEKIEELTLYIIEQKKEIEALQAQLEDARAINAGYETKMQDFEERLSKMEVGGAPLRAINDNYDPANDNEVVERMMQESGGR